MARHEDISNAIWGDPDFESLPADAKLLYLWTFTNPLCNLAGIYKVSVGRMSRETALATGRVERSLEQLAAAGFVFYEDQWLWVRSRVKHIKSKSPSVARAIRKDIEALDPDVSMRQRFLITYASLAWVREALDGLAKPNQDTLSTPSGHPGTGVSATGTGTGTTSTTTLEEPRPDVDRLCSLLGELVVANGRPKHLVNPASAGWRAAARLLLDTDKRPAGEAERLVRWCQADEFWRSNILSMPKFREKYDQLRLKAGPVNGTRPVVDRTDDRLAEARL